MARKLISSGSPFEKTAGYSRAVAMGDWCFVSGTTGYDYATMAMPETVEEQARNCLKTIEGALKEAGFSMKDVVRNHYYVTDASFADRVFPIFGEVFGEIRPATSILEVPRLIDKDAQIEIEADAIVP